jgi:two-component system phosphate regulon sensor histidine kinase PhoR
MTQRTLVWNYLTILLLVLALLGGGFFLYAAGGFRGALRRHALYRLRSHTRALASAVGSSRDRLAAKADTLLASLSYISDIECDIITPDGRALGSASDETMQYTSLSMPEIQTALKADTGEAVRYSDARAQYLAFVAVPVVHEGRVQAIVHTVMPVIAGEVGWVFYSRALQVFIAVCVVGMVLIIHSSRAIATSLGALQHKAERFSQGDLTPGYEYHAARETARLSRTLNEMGATLNESIQTLTHQKNERRAIFSAMVEGVVAVDTDERIIFMNEAAAHILDVSEQEVTGRWVQQVLRSSELQEFVRRLLAQRVQLVRQITFSSHFDSEKTIEVQGNVLADETQGVIFVLHDITHLKRLENMRKEFVANVSHELRTPVTTIKGFVETLLGGAADTPKERTHFLTIIEKHVNRLNALIDDLMAVSRLEKDNLELQSQLEPVNLDAVVTDALEIVMPRAQKRDIRIAVEGQRNVQAMLEASLFEQALINLVDNAIKYSDPGTTVRIDKKTTESAVEISVRDQGQGIAREHIPRLFERFYRVDKARSRNVGGTGLGLSIVKHIVTAHNGTIQVESNPGRGSTFTIVIPNTVTKELA